MIADSLRIRLAGCVFVAMAWATVGHRAEASLAAVDNASNAPYGSWDNGDNGGTGWGGGWTLSLTNPGNGSQNGHFMGSSTTNGNGDGNSDGDVDTAGRAWGLYANSDQTSSAVRPFSGDLQVGQAFIISMDNGFINNTSPTDFGTVGFGLQNASNQNLFEFFFKGGDSSYKVNRNGGSVLTSIGFTDEGLRLAFVLTDSDSFSFTIDRIENGVGVDATVTGDLISQGDLGIEKVRLFNFDGGGGGSNNAFFNSMAIVPESSAFLLAGLLSGLVVLPRPTRALLRRAFMSRGASRE
jgi:hypothetical protein